VRYAYALIDLLIPGAFQMPAADLQSRKAQSDAFLYFSIVTAHHSGYGDITAVHPVARVRGHDGGPAGSTLPGYSHCAAGHFARWKRAKNKENKIRR